MKEKPVSQSQTQMAQLMMPDDANHAGFIHGGVILSIADKVAYVCATRHAESPCVTLSADHVEFKKMIKIGDLVELLASVNFVGTTSLEIGIKIMAEDVCTGEKRHTNSCYFTMVAINAKGEKVKVPRLKLEKEVEKRRFEDAKKRREFRLTKKW